MPTMAALRENFPDALITLLVSSECADLFPAILNIDRILITRRNLRDIAVFLAIVRERFDYCIDFTRNDRSAFLAFLSCARRRVVSYRVREQSKTRARIYNQFADNRMRDMHTVDYNLALAEPLGVRNASRAVHLGLPEPAREKAKKLLRDSKIGSHFIIFHPGSARIEKFWDPACWAQVISHTGQNTDLDLVLTSGTSPLEQVHIAEIKAKTRQRIRSEEHTSE